MRTMIRSSWAIVLLGCVGGGTIASGQVVERDTKLTGPKGRTIERSIRTERGPGFVDRQVEIKRPGGTLIRDTRIQQPGGFGPRPGFPQGPPRRQVVERDFVVERDVVVERPALIAPFVAPFLSFSFGSPPPPPPPPPPAVVYVPEPVYVEGPPIVAMPPMVIAAPAYGQAPPAPVVSEPPISPQVADAMGRLASFHHQSRRDGALTLGHLGDTHAVGPLTDRLDHDLDREVRVASAWALGEIADPRAAVALERAALYDKRQEVRDAANTAYRKLPRPVQQPSNAPLATTSPIISQPSSTVGTRSAQARTNPVVIDPGPEPSSSSDTPPPLPTPASSPEPRR